MINGIFDVYIVFFVVQLIALMLIALIPKFHIEGKKAIKTIVILLLSVLGMKIAMAQTQEAIQSIVHLENVAISND